MFNLLGNKRSPIALDLGSDSVKLLQMERVAGALTVCAGGWREVPDSVRESETEYQKFTVDAVRQMLREGRFRGRKAVSALTCRQLSIKNVRIPRLPEHERYNAVLWEAGERFAFDIEPDRLNYWVAGEVRQGAELRDEVLMLAVSSEVITRHLDMLDEMDLTPVQIGAEPVAVFLGFERFLRRKADEETVSVVVDIGLSATRVIVARGRTIVFVKSIDMGGRILDQAVASQLGLSRHEARELRGQIMHEQSQVPDRDRCEGERAAKLHWTVHDAVRGVVEDLARELALCLRYCSVTFRGLRPARVILTGGQSYDPALVSLLADNLGIECEVGQCLKGVDTSRVDLGGDRRGMLAEWSVCAGLAFQNMSSERSLRKVEHAGRRLSA